MSSNIIMPALGFDMVEGTIVRWLKHEGEHVEKGQPVAEVETGKAIIPIESATAGVLDSIKVPAGQTVAINTVIATINAEH